MFTAFFLITLKHSTIYLMEVRGIGWVHLYKVIALYLKKTAVPTLAVTTDITLNLICIKCADYLPWKCPL